MGIRGVILLGQAWVISNIHALLIGLVVFLLTSRYLQQRGSTSTKQSLQVPGPSRLELWGLLSSVFSLGLIKGLHFHEILIHWGKKFDGVFMFNTPPVPRILVLNDFEALKEAFKNPDLCDRAPNSMRDYLFRGKGLLFSSGETWREQRKFTSTVLRSFGVGKRSFESEISDESRYLLDKIRSMSGKPFNPTHLLSNAVGNVICSVTFGKRYEYEDATFKRMFEYIELIVEREIQSAIFTEACPPLIHMPFGPIKTFRNYLLGYRQCIREIIQEHRESFDHENMRDLIDVYLNEIRIKQEQGVDTKLNEDNMEALVEDLFLAGSETTATSLRWSILLMMAHQEVQKRVQRELDSIVGRDRLPSLSDRSQLPYTEATIQEALRYGTLAPLGAPHFTQAGTTYRGYNIPKDTMVLGNLWSISRDQKLWKDPNIDEFNPEGFLDENNVVVKPDHHIVFGLGRRACIGEQLAKMEVFIFFTHLLHQFTLKKPHESYPLCLRGKSGAVHAPSPYEVCIEQRIE